MEDVLFIGNGLNRCEELGLSWGELLRKIKMEDYNDNNFNTLEFERLVFQKLRKEPKKSKSIYGKVKKQIAEQFKSIPLPDRELIHGKFLSLPITTIMTTNYDYVLERIIDRKQKDEEVIIKNKATTETKYSLYRYLEVKDKKIYHIHGEVDKPNSILLGYEHYVGTVQELRGMIHKKDKQKIPFIERVLLNKEDVLGHWGEFFFTHNIYIVGFGFDYSEQDLWWLLTYRAMLYYTNNEKGQELLKNKIVYYDIQNQKDDTYYQQRQKLFEDFHVEYQKIELYGDNYKIGRAHV